MKNNKNSIVLIACSLLSFSLSAKKPKPSLYILIHGTWASSDRWHRVVRKLPMWYQPGNKSFEELKKRSGGMIIAHKWSGDNHLSSRIEGAKKLVSLIKKYAATHTIHIIGHSHGGNVALLALDTLARHNQFNFVHELILLGTPIYLNWYPHSLKAAHRIYNIFSYGDVIQPVGGMYERVLPEYEHVFNIQLKVNTNCPMHNQLYKVELIEQVPYFHKFFGEKNVYCLHCTTGKEPVITLDFNREQDLATDKTFTQKLLDSWTEIRDKHAGKTTNNNRFARLWHRGTQYYKTAATVVDDLFNAD
jgi:hypothetical protein